MTASYKRRIHGQQEKTHVIFLIHLPRYGGAGTDRGSTFVGFQGGAWISTHIDDIRAPSEGALTLNDALSAPISELFYNMPFDEDEAMEIEDRGLKDLNAQNVNQSDFTIDLSINEEVSVPQGGYSEYDNINEELQPLLDIKMDSWDDQVSFYMLKCSYK